MNVDKSVMSHISMDLPQQVIQTNGKLFSNFEFVFKFLAENRNFSKEYRGVNIDFIAMCYTSTDSSQRAL